MHRIFTLSVVLTTFGVATIGCSPTYSPPVRTTHVGAPRR